MPHRKPVFYDEQQHRWRRTRRALDLGGVIGTILLITFLVSVLLTVDLSGFLQPERKPGLHAVKSTGRAAKPRLVRTGRRRRVAALGKVPENYEPVQAAFYVSWDPTSLASLQQNYRHLDLLIPELLHAVSPEGRLAIVSDPKLAGWMQQMQQSGIELPTMAMVNNYDGAVWRTPEMVAMLASAAARAELVRELAAYAVNTRQAGLVVDFEEIPATAQPNFRRFISELASGLHAVNLKIMVALPARDDNFDYAYFGRVTDAVILMNYDQHWVTSPAGPIAAQDWFAQNIEETLRDVPTQKLIMAIANYAYDWPVPTRHDPHPPAASISYQEAIVHATESEAKVEFDSDQLNPFYSYDDENNRTHRVWMLDGVTAFNQIHATERRGTRGVALWRLGSEDPSLWSIFEEKSSTEEIRSRLTLLPPGFDIVLEGDGDIWRIGEQPQPGSREIQYDEAADAIVGETYTKYPTTWQIEQMGALPGKIALTFDDGPDPAYTPRILDILHAKQAPATFFVIGLDASNSPALLRRIYNEGHEIGNHTYTHPHFSDTSRLQIKLELNLTERLFGSLLGIKPVLFRPPYGIDHQPESADEVAQLPIPQSLGYIIIGSRIDPHDWGGEPGGGVPSVQQIVARVREQALAHKGNIVLLHDGGGNRSNTVAALPQIIDELRAAGFELVPVSMLLGQTRAQVMPPLDPNERLVARADSFVFDSFHLFRLVIVATFAAGIALVSARAIFVGLLALVEKARPAPAEHPDYRPRVSILVPAHDEEAVILDTVNSALASDYPEIEVVVVNDGSNDRTGALLDQEFGGDPRVRIHHQPNRGKPAALNQALALATGEIIVTIDADTVVQRDAVKKLVRHFADPRFGAVAGNVKVGNRTSWITRWQALEYITSQNMEKRAFDLLNCITVVPGALGAWRAEAIRAAGGFAPDTLAEDTDLTFSIRRRGWRISYDEDAEAFTEAPETPSALIRQRFRWTYGTLQAVWKHRDTLGRPRYGSLGFIAIPNIFLFQLVLPLISPVIDLLFLGTLLLWGLAQLRITRLPQLWTAQDVERSLIFFVIFMLIDFLTCVVAFALEKHEDWTLLLPLLLQRFYYRQMMYIVLFRAVIRAWQGSAVGWRGVEPQPRPVTGA
jgi:cellulose synthase/poly-beta-1,6-N-acetylglucosamine synthase-like glycosyltransferase/spore germination protein YaaH/peptidoglycan/xylan/chitin deacetylase (PgdA/CDA1 family)